MLYMILLCNLYKLQNTFAEIRHIYTHTHYCTSSKGKKQIKHTVNKFTMAERERERKSTYNSSAPTCIHIVTIVRYRARLHCKQATVVFK